MNRILLPDLYNGVVSVLISKKSKCRIILVFSINYISKEKKYLHELLLQVNALVERCSFKKTNFHIS
jgi:hypothetical protein